MLSCERVRLQTSVYACMRLQTSAYAYLRALTFAYMQSIVRARECTYAYAAADTAYTLFNTHHADARAHSIVRELNKTG